MTEAMVKPNACRGSGSKFASSSSKDTSEVRLLKQVVEVFLISRNCIIGIPVNSLFCLQSKEMGGALSTLQALDAKDETQEKHTSKAEGNMTVVVLCD